MASESWLKLEALTYTITRRRTRVKANIVPFKVEPAYTVQPVGYADIYTEALHRATSAHAQYVAKKRKNPLYAVGMQTGIVVRRGLPYEILCTVIIAANGYTTTSWGMPVRLPHWLWQEYRDKRRLANGDVWEVGRRIAELDPLCEHNTLLYLTEGEIRDSAGRPLGRTFLLWQVLTLGLLQQENQDVIGRRSLKQQARALKNRCK